jgi:DNA-binding transcriptional MocR family regulator
MCAVMDVLTKNMPAECKFHRPEGGYYVWLQLPAGTDAADFCDYSLKNNGATAFPGKFFSESKTNCLRIAVAYHEKAELVNATELICTALRGYLQKS